jgi:aspartyl aminopeptidase
MITNGSPISTIYLSERNLGNDLLTDSDASTLLSAIPNSERIYVVSADHVSLTEPNFNEKSRVSASENFEFGIAVAEAKNGKM